MNKIIVTFNDRVVSEIPFKGTAITIGRGPGNNIKIDHPSVSSKHGRILREKDYFFIEDSGSTNGTFLNGKKVERSIINSTDDITIGKHLLKLGWEQGTGEYDDDSTPADIIPSLDETMMFNKSSITKGGGSARKSTGGFAIMEGVLAKERIEIKDRVTTIGKSSDALIKLKGLLAPKVAALINRSDRGYVITAPNPKKPPVINGKSLDRPYILKNGDIVEVGGMTLRFYLKK